MKSKLEKLFNNPDFGKSAKNIEPGIMLYKNKEMLSYFILTYDEHYEIYLSLFDETRDYLAYSKANDLEEAKRLATIDLEKKINKTAH